MISGIAFSGSACRTGDDIVSQLSLVKVALRVSKQTFGEFYPKNPKNPQNPKKPQKPPKMAIFGGVPKRAKIHGYLDKKSAPRAYGDRVGKGGV